MKRNIKPLNLQFATIVGKSLKTALKTLALLITASLAFTTSMQAQVTIEKTITGVEAAPGTGHIYVNYEVRVTNVSAAPLMRDNQVVDNAYTDLGAAFVGVSTLPALDPLRTTAAGLSANANYDGGLTDANLLLPIANSALVGQYYTITYSLEVNTALAAGDLTNTAMAFANDNSVVPAPVAGTPVSDDATLQSCWDNCALACNNSVYISVNTMCEADIFAEMVLEGEDQACADLGFYVVEIEDKAGNPIALPLDVSYIGQELTAIVTNIACGNSCWANLLVEDKTPPRLMCDSDTIECDESTSPYNPEIGFPVPFADITMQIDDNTFEAANIDACGSVTLWFRDSVIRRDCTDPDFSSVIYRKWTAEDASGLMVMCWDTIYLIRGTVADITLPPHYDGINGNNDYLECNGSWCKLPNGFPAPTDCGTGAPSGILCGNIQFDYYDDTIKVCESTFKLLRTWLIIDWCNPNDKIEYIQLIKVVDIDGPQVICPVRTPLELNMGEWSCSRRSYIVPEPIFDPTGAAALTNPHTPIIIEECGTWDYSIRHLSINEVAKSAGECALADLSMTFQTANVRQLPNGRWEVFDIPAGCNWIKYTITDDCGNSTECGLELFIKDDVDPIAVCHEHTTVSLTSDGKARVNASSFDDGSHDNCELGLIEVRRMNSAVCPSPVASDTRFRDYVEFCCADIARSPIMVVLRVHDLCGGNYSECMVEVNVQDKLPPIMTYCPPDGDGNCTDDFSDQALEDNYGSAEAFDNCNVIVTVVNTRNLNSCNVGSITRRFTATDDGGRTAICTQTIIVTDNGPFTGNDIEWPNLNVVLNDGCLADTDPDVLGKPTFRNKDQCNQIATAYDDLVFSQVDGACLKILRRWRVIDWCQFDATRPDECFPRNPGRWCATQVIKVNDLQGPEFTDCTEPSFCATGLDCTTDVSIQANAIDKCTPANLLIWRYEFDEDNDGDIDIKGNRNFFNRRLKVGWHHITWYAEDQCGNITICAYRFDVKDCKKPTPYCKTGVTTVIMPTTKSIEIWASDFDAGSFDNCTDSIDLKYSFRHDVYEPNRIYNCDSLNGKTSDTFEVTIFVIDEEGLKDFCRTKFILQDNAGGCTNTVTGNIAGLISSRMNDVMNDVEVSLQGSNMTGNMVYASDNGGHFAFDNMAMYENYGISASNNVDPLNGISTLDLVLIQRHLLGFEEFTSPYEYIAADVNNSTNISASDISELRKLVLGLYSEFPNNESWRFVEENQSFTDPTNPFPFNEVIELKELAKDEMENNFVAVKIGDISGDAKANGVKGNTTRSAENIFLSTAEMVNVENGQVTVPIIMDEADVSEWYGVQFTLTYNAEQLNFLNINSASLNVNNQDVALISGEDGIITLSCFDPLGLTLAEGDILFNLTFETQSGSFANSWINVNSQVTAAQAYDNNKQVYNINWRQDVDQVEGYALHQNTPNPFKGTTSIAFELPKQTDYSLEIFDMSGKVLKKINGIGYTGYQQLEIDLSQFSESAVLYYQLNTGKFTATKKMVIID